MKDVGKSKSGGVEHIATTATKQAYLSVLSLEADNDLL